jgi:hypothetical protein
LSIVTYLRSEAFANIVLHAQSCSLRLCCLSAFGLMFDTNSISSLTILS